MLAREEFSRPGFPDGGDDVRSEINREDDSTFADKQRKGIRDDFDGCSSRDDHIRRAIWALFRAKKTPVTGRRQARLTSFAMGVVGQSKPSGIRWEASRS